MFKVIEGTTPAIKFIFGTVEPSDITKAVLTVMDGDGAIVIEKALNEAVVGSNYISWTLTQEDTLALEPESYKVMCNWITRFGVRGASKEEQFCVVKNHIEEVL